MNTQRAGKCGFSLFLSIQYNKIVKKVYIIKDE